MKLIVATRNKHKLEEIHAILSGLDVELHSALDFPEIPDVVEDGETFEANAIKKAVTLARVTGCWALAYDSGLEVDALCGAPGVYSARYAGEPVSYPANNAKLLRELAGQKNRRARFRCVMALSDPAGRAETVDGRCEGHIIEELRGVAGFGYDPLFVPDGCTQTFAEMPAEQKNSISHRGRALQAARAKWTHIFNTRGAANPAHKTTMPDAGHPQASRSAVAANPTHKTTMPDSCGRGLQPRELNSASARALPHSAALREHRFDASGHIYFVTKRRATAVPLNLAQPAIASEIMAALKWQVEQRQIWLLGFVIMPDHVHLVLAPRPPRLLQEVMHTLCRHTARVINSSQQRTGALWAEEYYEHVLTGRGKIGEALNYIYQNPVRKGLVTGAADWSFSSLREEYRPYLAWDWFQGMQE